MKWQLTALAIVLLGICGCIPYDDPGELWNRGQIDRRVEGYWTCTNRASLGSLLFTAGANDLACTVLIDTNDPTNACNPTFKVRSVLLGGTAFLMFDGVVSELQRAGMAVGARVETNADAAATQTIRGWLVGYSVSGNTLMFHTFENSQLNRLIESGRIVGRAQSPPSRSRNYSVAVVSHLDTNTVAALTPFIRSTNNWSAIITYTKTGPVPSVR